MLAALTAPLPYNTASKARKGAATRQADLPRAVLFDMTNDATPPEEDPAAEEEISSGEASGNIEGSSHQEGTLAPPAEVALVSGEETHAQEVAAEDSMLEKQVLHARLITSPS